RMKVLVVSGEYPPMKGGVGRYTFNLVHALAKKPDVEVSVAIGADAAAALTSDPSQDTNNDVTTTATTYRGTIRKGDKRNSDRILQIISEIKPDVVNIQYERGLYEVDTTIRHTFWRLVHGSTLDRFYKMCPVPTVSTLHTVFPQDEYSAYIKDRALRKEGRFGFLPQPLRAAIRRWVMKQRYDLLLQVVNQSDGVISPARTLQEVVRRGTVIYHGAEPAIEFSSTSSLMNDKKEFRKGFGLPVDKMILLAFGYAGSYKGFDVLGSLDLPNGWSLAVKQTKHERGFERPLEIGTNNNNTENVISLNLGYLDDTTMSKLFFACDAIIFPYKIVSISGVMFDALAHGLPFVASDLRFFKEFADMGLGIVCKRTTKSFERSISTLASEYDEYKTRVEQFRSKLRWSNIANKHIEFFSGLISQYNNSESAATRYENSARKQSKRLMM
ncbi:MAG TPA: glycosyltransferase, partial [Nitrososphaeraceae archaeon]|nr:glycosyltransferase [Nitrososphaeraceae archaeon]